MLSNLPSTITSVFPNIVLPVFIIIGIGYMIERRLHLGVEAFARLNLYVLGPALVFASLNRSTISGDEAVRIWSFVIILALVTWIISLGTTRALRYDRSTESGYLLTTILMNCGNIGLPVTLLAFGEEGLQRAILFFVAQAVFINPLAIYLASRSQSGIRQALGTVFRMPIVYAAALAMVPLLGGPRYPDQLVQPVNMLGDASIPVMLLMLGMQLATTSFRERLGGVSAATFTRLIVSVPLAVGLASLLGLGPLASKVSILEAAMPTAVTSVILSIEFKADPRFVTSVVLVTTVISMGTLTAVLAFIK